MCSALDYESPPAPSKPPRTWIGVLVISAMVCGVVAWGVAAEARQGPLPGELAMSSILGAASFGQAGLAIGRTLRLTRGIALPVTVACCVFAGLFSVLAIWNLAHCRW